MALDPALLDQLKEQHRQELAELASKTPLHFSKWLAGAGTIGALLGGSLGYGALGNWGIPLGGALGITGGVLTADHIVRRHGKKIVDAQKILADPKRVREAEIKRRAMEAYLKSLDTEQPKGIELQQE